MKTMLIDRWTDKEDTVCIYTMEYYSGIWNEILPFAAMWIEPRDYYEEWISHRKTSSMTS